jgi:hypothetical protein
MNQPPKQGFTLEDISRLAAEKGVYIVIGVHKTDVGKDPVTVSFQVQDPGDKMPPTSFSCALDHKNPRLNMGLSMLLLQHVERIRPKAMRIITGR